MRYWLLILSLLLTGCAGLSKIAAPSEALYRRADRHFEKGEYSQAIEIYNQFLKNNPGSSLSIPAKLNLGMAYYYNGDFKSAHKTLKTINMPDENIKSFIAEITKDCENKLQEEAPEEKPQTGAINIKLTDVYMDEFGMLSIKGETNTAAVVMINDTEAEQNKKNQFSASITWKRGKPVLINAHDEQGNTGSLEYFPDSESPAEPQGLTVISSTANSAELEWDANSEDDIKGYKLYYRLQGGSLYEIREIIEDTDYEIVGLDNLTEPANRTFEFFLRATDKMNNISGPSDVIQTNLPNN